MPRVADSTQAEVGFYTYGRLGKNAKNQPWGQYIINVTSLRDPMSNRGFDKKYQDGRPSEVQEFVKEDSRMDAISDVVRQIAFDKLRSQGADHKWLSFGIMDHHGRWTAPAVGEILAEALSHAGYKVSINHVDLPNVLP